MVNLRIAKHDAAAKFVPSQLLPALSSFDPHSSHSLHGTVGMVACGASAVRPATIHFERSGGFVGIDDRLTIDLSTGITRLQRGKEVITATLNAEQRSHLATLVAAIDLASLAAMPSSPNQCCDFLSYRIQIDATTIQATDADLPASLQPLVTELNAIITGLHTP